MAKNVGGRSLGDGQDMVDNGITNPRYSPVVPGRGNKMKLKDNVPPEYIEMGVKNPGFSNVEEGNAKPTLGSFRAGQNGAAVGQAVARPADAEPAYLQPVESPTGGRICTKPNDPHYEDLGQILAKIETGSTSRSSTVVLPKKKANLLYEPSKLKEKKIKSDKEVFEHDHYYREVPCCLICAVVIIGLLALFATVLSVLLMGGAIKVKNCQCGSTNVASNTGSQQGQGQSYSQDKDLALKLKLMEDNITALKIKMLPQEIELLRLQNITLGQQIQIQILQDRLNEEEMKNKKLNSSVEVLNNMQQILETTTNIVNKTLSARIDELQQQVNNQNTKVNGMDVRKNITDLTSMIANEAKFRQSNDSLLRSELASKTRVQAEMIGNLSASLDAVNRTTLQTIKNTEDLFYQLLNISVQSLQVKDQSISNKLMALNSSLSNQIRNISLTPGPQGPPGSNGAGNLTACYYVTKRIHTSGFRALMYLDPPANTVLTGVFCFADAVGLRFQYLTTYNQPHCECRTEALIPGGFHCHISAWLCPKTS